MHSIISKSTSSLVSVHRRILSLIHLEYYHTYNFASTARTVAPHRYRHGRWTPKEKESSHDRSSEIPEEPARYCRTCPPTQSCSDGRARPPRWHGDIPPPRCPEASASSLAHATTTKQGSRQRRAGSSPTYAPGRQHLPKPARRSPVPDMAPLIKPASSAKSTTRMRDRHRRRWCGNNFFN